jgi:hypothetical protein
LWANKTLLENDVKHAPNPEPGKGQSFGQRRLMCARWLPKNDGKRHRKSWTGFVGQQRVREEATCQRSARKEASLTRHWNLSGFFLVYVARTYTTLVPYLKGIHLTLDSWRVYRGDDGWPIDDDGWRLTNAIDDRLEDPVARQGGLEPPKFVKEAARLGDDLTMLLALTATKEPPRVPVRASQMFADASCGGFGTSLWSEETGMTDLTYGTWESSNFREFTNFVRRVD